MSDLTPRELHKADLIYQISKKRQVYDIEGNLVLNYTNTDLLDKYPNLGFLCYNSLDEKYSVLCNRNCQSIMKQFDNLLGYIIEQDDAGNIEDLWLEMAEEPNSFIYRWYFGILDDNDFVDEVNQDRMYDYIRHYRTQKTAKHRENKPKKTNDGLTIKEKCEKANVNYRRVLSYRSEHPEKTEDEVIEFYRKRK